MPSWSIGYPEKERLEVVLSPELPSESGYEWLSAQVKIAAGGFTGNVSLSILFSELLQFKKELEPVYHTLHGRAEFKTLEGQLHLVVTVDKTGHITVTGMLREDAGTGNELRFEIRFD